MTARLPIDWAELWHDQVVAEHAQYDRLCDPRARPGSDWWAACAQQFHARSRHSPQPDAFLQQVAPYVQPGTTVLDVGAGSGRYALPLARMGARVMAVDPSAAMLAYLQQDADAEGLSIDVRHAAWDAVDLPPADLVICAHVLYPIADAAAFLYKLHEHRQQRCWLLLGYEAPSAWLRPFWHAVYGEDRLPLPGAIHALAVLHQLGIDAQLTPILSNATVHFDTLDQAIDEVRSRLCLLPDRMDDRQLGDLIEQHLQPRPAGGYQARMPSHVAVLTW